MVLGMSSSAGGKAPNSGDNNRGRGGNNPRRREYDSSRHQQHQHTESSQQPSQTGPTSVPATVTMQSKHMPSAEQVHIARMLTDDRTPFDIRERILQVQSVVDCVEDSIVIALHDNEFDITKACEALLDSNGSSNEEWMTMSTSKKSKKKEQKSSSTRGSSKAASLSTRQNYGGSVTVTTVEGDSDKKTGGGRQRGTTGPKGGGGGRGERRRERPPPNTSGGYRNRKQEGRYSGDKGGGASFEGRFPPRHRHKETVNEEKQSYQEEVPTDTNTEVWGNIDDNPPTSEDWVIVDTPPPVTTTSDDAVGRHFYTEDEDDETHEDTSAVEESFVKEKTTAKQRRFKASQIPSEPVEMPSGIDDIRYEIDMLGIGFGVETTPIATPTEVTPTTVEPRVPTPLTYDQPLNTQQPLSMSNTNTSLLSSSPYTDITDDPIIISSIKGPPDDLEPPPGLVHPSQQQPSTDIVKPATPTLLPPPPDPISLPPLSQAPPTSSLISTGMPLSEGGVTSDSISSNTVSESSYVVMKHHPSAGSSSNYSASNVTISSTTHSLFSTSSVPTPQTTQVIVTPAIQQPSSLSSNNNSSSQTGVSSQRVNTSMSNPTPQGGSGIGKAHSTSSTSASSGNVHPMAVYPPAAILPQFHPPYGTTPVMMPGPYTYDVDSLNRYHNQGFYGQHPTSQEQGGGASLSSGIMRDPQSGAGGGASSVGSTGTLPFTTDNKYDTGPTSTQTQQQTLQQQPAAAAATHNQINHPFYSQFPYLMYPMGMATATGYSTQPMGHKPSGGTSYPTGTSYQPMGGSHQYPYADDVYSLKSNQVTSTTSADFSAAAFPKHQYEQKGNTFGYNMPPLGMAGGYVMGPPPPNVMSGGGHESSRSNKSHKFGSVQSAVVPSVWPSTQHT